MLFALALWNSVVETCMLNIILKHENLRTVCEVGSEPLLLGPV